MEFGNIINWPDFGPLTNLAILAVYSAILIVLIQIIRLHMKYSRFRAEVRLLCDYFTAVRNSKAQGQDHHPGPIEKTPALTIFMRALRPSFENQGPLAGLMVMDRTAHFLARSTKQGIKSLGSLGSFFLALSFLCTLSGSFKAFLGLATISEESSIRVWASTISYIIRFPMIGLLIWILCFCSSRFYSRRLGWILDDVSLRFLSSIQGASPGRESS